MMYRHYIASDNTLGITTNSNYVGWSFGLMANEVSQEQLEQCKVAVKLTVDPLSNGNPEKENVEKYHYWQGTPNSDSLYYERNFVAGTKLRLLVQGILGGTPEIVVNKNYLKYISFRFNNLHSPGYHLTDLSCALLLRKNYCPLHCSSFQYGNSTVVVIAPPDTGKTLTTMTAVMQHGANFLSEDLGITDGAQLYACPWTSTFRYYDQITKSRLQQLKMRIVRVFPPVELLSVPGGAETIAHYIDKERIGSASRITHVAILARRPGGVHVLDNNEAKRLLLNLNRYEFVYMKSPMLTAYSYFNPELDVFSLVDTEKRILGDLVQNAECLLVQNEDPTHFAELIIDHIGNNSTPGSISEDR